MMKAIICPRFGGPEVLRLEEVTNPEPENDEVLIKIHAASVTAGDTKIRSRNLGMNFLMNLLLWIPMGTAIGFFKPKNAILGMEFAGEVVALGSDVTLFKKGDQVFGTTTGLKAGSYAEYVCIPEKPRSKTGMLGGNLLAVKPKNLSFQESAVLPIGATTALTLLNRSHIKEGQDILIYGASGSVGSYGVQLAKHFGAKVTGVCSNTNHHLVKSLGADIVLDYKKNDFPERLKKYDIILDAVGKMPKSLIKKSLSPNGSYCHIMEIIEEHLEDLLTIKNLAESKKIQPVIDKDYTLENISQAHSYVELGRKKGNVVIDITGN